MRWRFRTQSPAAIPAAIDQFREAKKPRTQNRGEEDSVQAERREIDAEIEEAAPQKQGERASSRRPSPAAANAERRNVARSAAKSAS